MESILTSTKKLIGISKECVDFDMDVILYVNSVFAFLHQLGVGPSEVFSISDDTAVWSDFKTGSKLEYQMVKTYVSLKVKRVFDPPTSSAHLQALEDAIEEYEWRMNVAADSNSEG